MREIVKLTGGFVFLNNCLTQDSNGRLSCSGTETFEDIVKNWETASKDEKIACINFSSEMSNKYGYGNHNYQVPRTNGIIVF